jgi:ketosteroid isomerase-like protein
MSQENVEASRHLWERFLADDLEGVAQCLDPAVEVHDPPDLPGARVYHGPDGWREQIDRFSEAFGDWKYNVLEHLDCGDQVVTVVEATATGAASGISGALVYGQLETWLNGRVTEIRYFTSKDQALEAAGLRG